MENKVKVNQPYLITLENVLKLKSTISLMLDNSETSKKFSEQLDLLTTIISNKLDGSGMAHDNIVRLAREIISDKATPNLY